MGCGSHPSTKRLSTRKGPVTKRKHHIAILAGLLGLSCLVQVVVIRRATVPGLDAVRFVRIAQSIDRHGLLTTLQTEREQPLFPVWVWSVHCGVEQIAGESADTWATAVQLAAAVSLVLTIVPLYFLMLRLAGPAAAAAGGLFFCLLPEVSRLGADGISDSTHLLFFCVALWAIVEYFAVGDWASKGGWGKAQRCPSSSTTGASLRSAASHPSTLWLTLAGVATATALLARAEVAVLAVALAVTMIAFQLTPKRRQPWRSVALAGGGYVLGAAAVLGPYLAALGDLSPRPAVARVLGRYEVEETSAQRDSWHLPGGEAAAFDVKERTISLRQRGYAAAAGQFASKLADAFGYWIGALALYGAWALRRGGTGTADRFVQAFFVLFSAAVIRFAAREGYLDARHLLTPVVAGMAAAGYGAVELGRRMADRFTGRQTARTGRWLCSAVAALACVACLPQVMGRLHENRRGHRAAAAWLATEADLPGAVLDTRGWTGLYSGRRTYTYAGDRAAFSDRQLAFVVLERRELHYDSPRARTLRWLIETAARPVGEFPDSSGRTANGEPVLVYRWYPERLAAAMDKPAATVASRP